MARGEPAGLHLAQRRYDEAEPLATECYERSRTRYGIDHSKTRDAIELLVELYTAWDQAEPGEGYDAKAAQWEAKLPPATEDEEP